MTLLYFLRDCLRSIFSGSWRYWLWVVFLLGVIGFGGWHYWLQITQGLVVTNLTNQVSWGFYIANFTFLVGVAAAAVMLAIPAYIFNRHDIKDVVLMGDTMAIGAVTMAILFVLVDLGRPDRIWHLLPGIGRFNFPDSLLVWDVIVLNGYLLLNAGISFYVIYSRYQGSEPQLRRYFPFVVVAIFWAISIHTVTAVLYSANSGRPFWSNALLAPRFIASAFASGPALMILGLQVIRRVSGYPIHQSVLDHLALVMTVALQVTLFFVGAELFTEFYNETEHAASARYLYFGLDGHAALVPWILIGLAGLQATSIRNNYSAFQRSQAVLKAYEAMDRMRANRTVALAGSYDRDYGDAIPAQTCTSTCTAAQMAASDLREWANGVQRMPSGDGAIVVDNAGVATVTVRWDDDRNPATNPDEFRLVTQL